jgi:hypothetical protein
MNSLKLYLSCYNYIIINTTMIFKSRDSFSGFYLLAIDIHVRILVACCAHLAPVNSNN